MVIEKNSAERLILKCIETVIGFPTHISGLMFKTDEDLIYKQLKI
jgi:hypothetical protein